MSYRLAFACSNSASQIKTLAEGGINLIHAYCDEWSDAAIFSLIQYCVNNGIKACLNLAPADKPDPFYKSGGGYCPGYLIRLETFKNEEGLFGLQIEEPYMRWITPEEATDFYNYAQTKNPDWKIFTAHGDDEWHRHGYKIDGYTDLCGTDLYSATPEGVRAKLVNLGYADAHNYMWDNWGIQCLPVIYTAGYDARPPGYILDVYNVWKDEITHTLAGIAYYPSSGFSDERIWKQVRNLNFAYLGAPFKLSGSLTFDKGFSWKVAIIKIGKFLYGGLNLSGTLPKKHITYPILSGRLSFSGAFGLTYTFLQSLTWAQLQAYTWKSISVRRLYLKFISPLLSGVFNFAGSLDTTVVLLIKKVISGALTFPGVLSRNFKLSLTAGISFGRAISLKAKQNLSGAINPLGFIFVSGTWLSICTKTYIFLETLTWSQFQSYTWCKPILKVISLSGFLSPTGLLPKKVLSSLNGALSLLGNPFFKVKSVIAGALSSSGIFTNIFIKTLLSGDVSFSSIIGRFIKYPLSGALSFLGWTQRTTGNLKYLLRKLIQLIQIKGSE